ncbi:MAG: hypothetical protein Q8Q09_21335 [Deltaproteobacteria bacterium]|nr:hypothetical protein [Deltaproteobacteria bacterium]
MAEVTIRFKHNPRTGKRELTIGYESDDDALPHEHERDHRAIVEKALGRKLGDNEIIVVERMNKELTPSEPSREEQPAEKSPEKIKNG